jgi:uncharacterized surface protein with fasciclin (FAS1) repeats
VWWLAKKVNCRIHRVAPEIELFSVFESGPQDEPIVVWKVVCAMKKWLFAVASIALAVGAIAPSIFAADEKTKGKTIVETAIENEDTFSTLVAAVKAGELVETLSGEGPFTVFAPTNEAFEKIDKAVLEDLLKPENKEKLVAILTYHVVAGEVMAEQVVKLDEAETVQGSKVKIEVKDDVVMLNDAKVIKTDIKCSNGVIHVIDTVIMPPSE